ncbi:MAG: hypothetical protein ABIP94_25040 [Planctomycetota bacterium]
MTSTLRPAVLWPLALLVGTGVFFLTCLVEPAETHTLNFGAEYGEMAKAPLALVGKFPHRVLGPLVAHVLGFAGERYWMFAHGCTALLIAMIFAAAVHFGARWWQAMLLTTVIAFTGTIQIYKGHVGYPDPITFLLLTATLMAARRPGLFWSLQALNLLNHEQILFFWPWLLYWRHRSGGEVGGARGLPDVVGGVVVASAYVLLRLVVGAEAQGQTLTMAHYLGLTYFPVGTLGLAVLNLGSTFIWFGLLPVLIFWHAFADGWQRAGAGIVLFVLCQHAMFGVAHDVYRFTCFLFVPLLFAGLRLVQRPHGAIILAALGAASVGAIVLQREVFVKIAITVMQNLPDTVPAIVPKVIPELWGTFTLYGIALLASAGIGFAWARRDRGVLGAGAADS